MKFDIQGATPLYRQLKSDLMEKVVHNCYKPGDRIPGEFELCSEYGLSRSTVRQALTELEQEGLLVRVRGKGTFVSGKTQSNQNRRWVALVGPEPRSYLAPSIIRGIDAVLSSQDMDMRYYCAGDDPQEMERMVHSAIEEGASGLLIDPPEEVPYNQTVYELVKEGFPIATFDRAFKHVTTDCAMTDNVDGGLIATSHLLSLGHRKIAFVSKTARDTQSVWARYEGYTAALRREGVKVDESIVIANSYLVASGENTWLERLRELLDSNGRPTAIFAVNDLAAMEIIRTAGKMGLSVPDDLAVVGFDNSDLSSRYMVPLTTVEQPAEEIGATAARLLLDRIYGQVREVRWILLPAKLVIRRSCGWKE